MSPKADDLLDELCDTAMTWGYQESEGRGSSVAKAENDYRSARRALAEYIYMLEVRVMEGRSGL